MLEGQCGLNSCSISLICSGKSVCRYSIPLGGKMLLDPWIRRVGGFGFSISRWFESIDECDLLVNCCFMALVFDTFFIFFFFL